MCEEEEEAEEGQSQNILRESRLTDRPTPTSFLPGSARWDWEREGEEEEGEHPPGWRGGLRDVHRPAAAPEWAARGAAAAGHAGTLDGRLGVTPRDAGDPAADDVHLARADEPPAPGAHLQGRSKKWALGCETRARCKSVLDLTQRESSLPGPTF